METFSALLALCVGNSPVTGEFPSQRPETRSYTVFFHLRLNKRLSKQSRRRWFETALCPLWRHSNDNVIEKEELSVGMQSGEVEVISNYDFSIVLWYAIYHIKAEIKWTSFCRQYFQMQFLEWKCMNIDWNYTEVYLEWYNWQHYIRSDNGSALTKRQAIVWINDELCDLRIYSSLGVNMIRNMENMARKIMIYSSRLWLITAPLFHVI